MGTYTITEFNMLQDELFIMFNVRTSLRIDLFQELRNIRNLAGLSGHTKIKQQAINYIKNANVFLD